MTNYNKSQCLKVYHMEFYLLFLLQYYISPLDYSSSATEIYLLLLSLFLPDPGLVPDTEHLHYECAIMEYTPISTTQRRKRGLENLVQIS